MRNRQTRITARLEFLRLIQSIKQILNLALDGRKRTVVRGVDANQCEGNVHGIGANKHDADHNRLA